MSESLKALLEQRDMHLPTVAHYGELLDMATETLHISREKARLYGLLTYGEWAALLNINTKEQ